MSGASKPGNRPVLAIADAHGNAGLVRGLLAQEKPGSDVLVVQLGDLANCVGASESDDLAALELVGDQIDLMLVGNHEHPHFGGPAFSGFWPHLDVRRKLQELNDRELIQPSLAVGSILLTHAGVNVGLAESSHPEEGGWKSAEAADEELRWAWKQNVRYPVFSAIGRSRGGWEALGGILWSDWSEPKTQRFRQLVGHTVGEDIRRRDRAICIDLGAGKGRSRIAGAWIRNGRIKVVIHEALAVAA